MLPDGIHDAGMLNSGLVRSLALGVTFAVLLGSCASSDSASGESLSASVPADAPTATPTSSSVLLPQEPSEDAVDPESTLVPAATEDEPTHDDGDPEEGVQVDEPGATEDVPCLIAAGTATVTCAADAITIESNGLPTHQVMVGIEEGGWNGQWPLAQDYTGANAFVVPTDMVLADEPALTVMNTAGVTANGIPFFFPHAPGRAGDEGCVELPAGVVPDGECLRDPVAVGEMDDCGGHTGRGNDYHYHGTPTCLIELLPAGAVIGYMLDGIPMHAEPLEGSVPYEGCSGWVAPDGTLHYAFSESFPYLTSCMLGEFSNGPRTEGSEVFTGDLDTRNSGSIVGFEVVDGCQVMTFSGGAELVHCP